MKGDKQNNAVWLQLSAGQGPKECGWVVVQLMRALLQDAQKHGIHADCVERLAFDKAMRKQSLIEPDTLLSCLIRLEGRALEKESLQGECLNSQSLETYAQSWVGPIKWQGESPVSPKT